jgi:hypothetical protein
MWWKHMLNRSNTPVRARAEDQPLIRAIDDACRRYGCPDAAAAQLLNDFTKPDPRVRRRIFELSDPALRASPFVTNDALAAFARDVLTSGRDSNARWADLTFSEQREARRIERFAQDKRRVLMGGGRPQNVDRALILWVIRRIEEATGVPFRFARPLPFCLGGPMLRLAEEALRQLFRIFDDRTLGYLGLVSPARHYTTKEIARTAEFARARVRASRTPPAGWSSGSILEFASDVRIELADKKNKDQGSSSPRSWRPWPSSWGEVFEAAVAGRRQSRLKYGDGFDVLQSALKSGDQPDLIELSKQRAARGP